MIICYKVVHFNCLFFCSPQFLHYSYFNTVMFNINFPVLWICDHFCDVLVAMLLLISIGLYYHCTAFSTSSRCFLSKITALCLWKIDCENPSKVLCKLRFCTSASSDYYPYLEAMSVSYILFGHFWPSSDGCNSWDRIAVILNQDILLVLIEEKQPALVTVYPTGVHTPSSAS